MKTKRLMAGICAFAMIFGLSANYINADEVTPFVYGDVDGDSIPQINDLTKMSLYLLHDMTFNETQKKAADVNADGNVDLADLATMKQFIMHDNVEFGKSLGSVSDKNGFDISKCQLKSQIMLSNPLYDIFSTGNRAQLPIVIDSQTKFDELKQLWPENNNETFEKFGSDLNLSEDFFKDNTLFIIAMIEGGTNSDTKISDIKLSEEKGISFEVNSSGGESSISMSSTWLNAAVIPNQYLDGIDKSKIRIINKGLATENDGILNYLDISACDVLNYKTSGYFDFLPVNDKDFKMSAVIRSREDFDSYNKKFNNSADKLSDYYGMSEEFFKDNTLFVIPVSESSGSNKDEIRSITTYPDKSSIYINVQSYVPAIGECDMATWHLAIAVPNYLIKNTDISDVQITRTVDREKYLSDDKVLDLTDCETVDIPDPYYYDFYKYEGFHSSLITSSEELYKYNGWMKLISDVIVPQRYNFEGILKDNVIVAIDDIGHSGMIEKYISGISVDNDNKITVDFTTYTPEGPLTVDYRKTHTCVLVPRKYLSKSSAQPTLEIIKHDINEK